MKEANKKGQVTMFIILSIIIVSGILVFFLYVRPTFISEQGTRVGFEGCIQDAMEESISTLEKNAGFVSPGYSYMYKDEEITYLCYTNEYYDTCTIQTPFVEKTFANQLEIIMRDKVDECYSSSIDELKAQGYEVTSGQVSYNIDMKQDRVQMQLEAPTIVGSQSFEKFSIELTSPIYEMTMIATTLLQYEVIYGDTDIDSLMRYYPDYLITKYKMSDGTTLYFIENKIYGNKFQFASRSLAFPPGYDIE